MSLAWGIAATGRIARAVGTVIAAHPDMHVAAVGSRSAERAAALARDLGAPTSHASYAALVDDPAVQAVYVATPHAQHAEVVEVALRAGKAVLCEKPLTASLAETERLAALAEQTGTFLMEGMWMRFNPLVGRLCEMVRSGALGDVRSLHAAIGFPAPYDGSSRLWNPELGGGALLDIGVYAVDFARLLLGDPQTVDVTGSRALTGVDAEVCLALSWPTGAKGLLDVSLVAGMTGRAVVTGTRGWAELGPAFYAPTRLVVAVDGRPEEEHEIADRSAGFVGELEEVARCVEAGKRQSDVLPLVETVSTARVLDDAMRQLTARG